MEYGKGKREKGKGKGILVGMVGINSLRPAGKNNIKSEL